MKKELKSMIKEKLLIIGNRTEDIEDKHKSVKQKKKSSKQDCWGERVI